MIRCLVILVLFFLSGIAHGQASHIDSLQRLILRETDPQRKVELQNQLAYRYFDNDIEKAGTLAFQALQGSRIIGDRNGEGWATAFRGVYFLFVGELGGAQNSLNHSLRIGRELNDSKLQTYSLNQLGNVFRDKGVFDSAYYFYRKTESAFGENPDQYYQSVVKMNKGRYYLVLSKPDSALLEISEALRLREALPDPSTLPEVWMLMANCYRMQFKYPEAEQYLERAIKAAPEVPAIRTEYMVNQGEIFFSQGNFPKALENWEHVLVQKPAVSYKYKLASLLVRMGEVFEEQGYYDLALEYLSRSLKISEKASFNYLMGEAYLELGWVFYRTKNLELADQNVLKAETVFLRTNQELKLTGALNIKGLVYMARHDYDSSLICHQQALKMRERLGNRVAISASLFNLGLLSNERKEYRKALAYFWGSSRIDESINDTYGKSLNYYQLGRTHNLLGGYDSAKFNLERAIALAIPNSANEILQNSYGEMAVYLQRIGKPNEAIEYYKKYIQRSDSLYNQQNSQSMAAYHSLYEVEKKEREIELLNKDNLLVRARAQRQSIVVYLVLGTLVVLVLIAAFYYRFTQRLKRLNLEISGKSEEIQGQSVKLTEANSVLTKLNQELKLSNVQLKNALDDLRKTQEQLIQSEKMASLGILSSGVAHELNNPLNFIKGGVNTLGVQLRDLDEAKQKEIKAYIDIINEGVNRSSAIIRGLSHYSRQSEGENEVCDIHKILDNCLLILNNKLKYRVTIERDYSHDPFTLVGNEGRLHQAFINILSNAEQAIEGNGTIRLKTQVREGSKTISISDTGCGIAKENMVRLGDPFFTTKPPGEGTGLGLSITYKIIKDHGGVISVASKPNEGTTFEVTFH